MRQNNRVPILDGVSSTVGSGKVIAIIEDPKEMRKLSCFIKRKENARIELKFVALNIHTYQELIKARLDCKMPADYRLSSVELEEEALNWFREFPNAKLRDGKNIKEILQHEGISVWWLIDEHLYLNQFVFTSVRESIRQIIMFDHILKNENPTMIWCTRQDRLVYDIIRSISRTRGIALVTPPPFPNLKGYLSRRLRATVYACGIWLVMLVRKIWWTLLGGTSQRAATTSGKRILIFSGDNWRNVFDLKTGAPRKGDMYFDSVVDMLREDNHAVVFVDMPTERVARWYIDTMKEKRREGRIDYRPFESYLSLRIILKAFKIARRIRKNYESLGNCDTYRNSLKWRTVPLWDLLKRNFSFTLWTPNLARFIAISEMAKRMMEMESPDGVLMAGEFPTERPVAAVAKTKGIPMLFFQHGTYSPYMLHYNHSQADISPDGEYSAPYCPVPDKLAVYSGYDKSNLVSRGKLSENDVIVIGQPRYDVIARAPEIFGREKTFHRLSLDPGKKLIVWTTETNALSFRDNVRNITTVYNAMKSLEEVQLLIKLHPGENQRAPLYKKDKSYKPLIVDREAITAELLYVSDLMLTSLGSTTIIEAMMLDKPVILMDLRGARPKMSYEEAGAVIGVYCEDDLIPAIRDALYNEHTQARLAEARRMFLHQHKYIQAGQASKRVTDLILHMIEKSTEEVSYDSAG